MQANLRKFLYVALSMAVLSSCSHEMRSPSSGVRVGFTAAEGHPSFTVRFHGSEVIGPSSLGIVADGDSLGTDSKLLRTRTRHKAGDFREYTCELEDKGRTYSIQFRLSDGSAAFRYILDGSGTHHISAEMTSFAVQKRIPVWFFERPNHWKLKSYAGEWTRTMSDSLWCISPNGPVQGAVLLYELPQGRYMALTEAALYRYSGLRYRALEDASLTADFTEGPEGFDTFPDPETGEVVTPWRVIMLADDLDGLVNDTSVRDLNPAPDPALFGDTAWIRPGRSVWSWWSDPEGYMTPELERHFIDAARELGYEYTLLDEGWELWDDKWDTLSRICSYASDRGVGVLVWKHSRGICSPEADYAGMREFLDSVKAAGVSGVKVDFMNSEAAAMIAFEERLLRECALRKMVVNFHGCQKPSGESRTYPNELTREGVRGLELNRMNQPIPGSHNVSLIFTRGLLGNMDYTPVGYSRPANTSFAHQTATAFAFTSPLTCIAEHVDTLLNCAATAPALPLLKALPTIWDETRVLPGSAMDRLALMARRSGREWYLVALSGMEAASIEVDLDFLGNGTWEYYGVCDRTDNEDRHAMASINGKVDADDVIGLDLLSEGGAVIRFVPL